MRYAKLTDTSPPASPQKKLPSTSSLTLFLKEGEKGGKGEGVRRPGG
jgi:hypothetical protein